VAQRDSRNRYNDELDVDLYPVAGLLLFIPFPPAVLAHVALRGGQPVEAQALEDAPHSGATDRHVVVELEVYADLRRTEVRVLPQMNDLPDHRGVRGMRTRLRSAGTLPQPRQTAR
jgi:hypothetical protein